MMRYFENITAKITVITATENNDICISITTVQFISDQFSKQKTFHQTSISSSSSLQSFASHGGSGIISRISTFSIPLISFLSSKFRCRLDTFKNFKYFLHSMASNAKIHARNNEFSLRVIKLDAQCHLKLPKAPVKVPSSHSPTNIRYSIRIPVLLVSMYNTHDSEIK